MNIHTLPAGPLRANCYLLRSGRSRAGVVIDPGGDAGRLLHEMEAMAMEPAAILLTHGHFDHTGGIDGLLARFPHLPVYLHPGDVSQAPSQFTWSAAPTWKSLSDNQKLSFVDIQLTVIHTPGHSPGSVVFRCGDALFTGDTLFRGSMGRVDFPGGDARAMLASLARLGALEGDLRVYPGHDVSTTLELERATNPYLREAMA